MYSREYYQGIDYIINFSNLDNIEEKFVKFVYEESLSRPFMWLIFTEDILNNKNITYSINTTSIISTYNVKQDESYYLFETLKQLLRIGAILKIIYKKEFIIVHYYNEFIKDTLTINNKWLNITVGELLLENKIVDKLDYNSLYDDYKTNKKIDLLLELDQKLVICSTNMNNIINNTNLKNIYISITNKNKDCHIPYIKFNYIKEKFINNFLMHVC